MFTKEIVNAQNLAADATEWISAKAHEENGEIASWMILAAGLAAAAVAALTILSPWLGKTLPNLIKTGGTN